jgi:predicted transcriptional regulator/transcriptional regulator with XRE-family HTH domain
MERYLGARLKRLREEQGLSQLAAARTLGLSASYYNQLEHDGRPVTAAVQAKLSAAFGIGPETFAGEVEARLFSDLREALSTSVPEEAVSAAELRDVVGRAPALARAMGRMHRRLREALERVDALADRMGGEGRSSTEAVPLMPFEEVRDFFNLRRNHFDELDVAAEQLFADARLEAGETAHGLALRLERQHGVKVEMVAEGSEAVPERAFDATTRRLRLASHLSTGQRAFQVATQLALLEFGDLIQRIVDQGQLSSGEARALARIGLANYFAGATLMPYGTFLSDAERLHYDIDLLGQRFGVGFEATCHRLSTLQRPSARGVPFFFIRVDRAGNISKRQSATDFHFSRVGGTCPLWNVYEAFAQPGRVLRQLAQMPDGRTYLCIARTVSRGQAGYSAPTKTFAVALGCDLRDAHRLVYSQGMDLSDPNSATPIGAGCKVCERPGCPQRAFPPVGRRVAVDENVRRLDAYAVT